MLMMTIIFSDQVISRDCYSLIILTQISRHQTVGDRPEKCTSQIGISSEMFATSYSMDSNFAFLTIRVSSYNQDDDHLPRTYTYNIM